MPTVLVTRYQTDGSGKKRTYKIEADVWHKSRLDGSNGPQPMWMYFTTDWTGICTARATVYEDRNPHRLIVKGKRLYRWDVFPADSGYSYARGECVSLQGAKDVAEACADMAEFVKPYNEKIHKR
jgi:hypothetical protein